MVTLKEWPAFISFLHATSHSLQALPQAFFARPAVQVAPDLIAAC
jgi:hypothetical protein